MDMHFDGIIYQSHTQELARRIQHSHPPFLIVDVRDAQEFAAGHIPGAVALQAGNLDGDLPQGTTPTTEFFIFGSGPLDTRVREMSLALREAGALRCVEIQGGLVEWLQTGNSIQAGTAAA